MGFVEDVMKSWGPSALVGVGVAVAIPFVLPVLGKTLRPVAKAAVKGYLALSDAVHEQVAGAAEDLSDLVAEAKAERAAELAASALAVTSGGGEGQVAKQAT